MKLSLVFFIIFSLMPGYYLAAQSTNTSTEQPQPTTPLPQPPPQKELPQINLAIEIGKCQILVSQWQQWASTRENDLLNWAVMEIQKRDAELAKLKARETTPEAK